MKKTERVRTTIRPISVGGFELSDDHLANVVGGLINRGGGEYNTVTLWPDGTRDLATDPTSTQP